MDCGVHFIDVMCQKRRSNPVQVTAIGARLTEDIPIDNHNYGQLQIRFEDGSDLTQHAQDAVNSLQVALTCDESVKTCFVV